MEYLEKVGLNGGIRKFEKMSFSEILVPENHTLKPSISNSKLVNQIREISG